MIFFEASIIMNVIVGVIVDSVNTSRKEIEEENIENSNIKKATLESISAQISELQNSILEIKKRQKSGYPNLDSRFKDSETRLE